ncbi:TPA: trimethoprim-resistant dihydrofolate reductase DfrA24 [Escherichia coli]|uniref:trimethoprim-resistant dihydrofolate reductase DfrA24 n=1 Tax=Enterobacterales TaxID=91347 RepID=UPI0009415BF2|nr:MULTISPECIES: trimethoprim-resistant dihydrofolate reductase DfrA24 [Enterobacterales]HDS7364838.1 trimethoprim-resistant dihydrofolate reductase DfrA24 [Morganella morganii subsp. morganii]EFN9826535.1 trimethoprim-resistant dihydrofolate reductase DfrA24 [Escherichia coli]EFN9826856.1 trimethoprim-resistant dihydrofolate reductase DfrA24 [Escherichia coli]EID9762043.1 trimethoprim-resistant dihydrofolate reductase DfrA24 [Escherichia coli]EID9762136.1 trimethoprim-resistant dihydrofolate 
MTYQLDVSKILSFDLEAIVAATENGGIGYKGDLPWRLQGDLKRFREITQGGIVIMGAGTYKSLPSPLKDRINIVITKKSEISWTACYDVRVVNSPEDALRMVGRIIDEKEEQGRDRPRVFVIGGASIYQALMPFVSTLHWTEVHVEQLPEEIGLDTYIEDFLSLRWDFYTEEKVESGFTTHTYHTLKRN